MKGPPNRFLARLTPSSLGKILGEARNRPKAQVAQEVAGRRKKRFVFQYLDQFRSRRLAKRVRNNLFHGGKEDSGEQPFDGDDEWVQAALRFFAARRPAARIGHLQRRAK